MVKHNFQKPVFIKVGLGDINVNCDFSFRILLYVKLFLLQFINELKFYFTHKEY